MGATGQSGLFWGHAIPGAICAFVGFFQLLLSLKRARALRQDGQQQQQSFCETYVPEKNVALMRTASLASLALLISGILLEMLHACTDDSVPKFGCMFFPLGHEALYAIYGSAFLVMLLETLYLLPFDSWRAMMVLANLLAYVLWNEHARMKQDYTDNLVHTLMAQVCLAHAAVLAFSIYNPSNLAAYIGSQGMFVLEGAWLVTIGVNADFHELNMQRVAPLFCFEVVLVTLSIIVVGALCGSASCRETQSYNSRAAATEKAEYAQLAVPDGQDEEDRNEFNSNADTSVRLQESTIEFD